MKTRLIDRVAFQRRTFTLSYRRFADLYVIGLLLLLSSATAFALYTTSFAVHIDLHKPSLFLSTKGFFAPEKNESFTYTFSTNNPKIYLGNMGGEGTYHLRMRLIGWRPPNAGPALLTWHQSNHAAASFAVRPEPAIYRFIFTHGNKPTWLNWTSTTFVPSDRDPRKLGVAFDWVEVTSFSISPTFIQIGVFLLFPPVFYAIPRRLNVQIVMSFALTIMFLLIFAGMLTIFPSWKGMYHLFLWIGVMLVVIHIFITPWIKQDVLAVPETMFAFVATITGTLLLIITPPFQVADEHTHLYRAYHISEGYLVAVTEPNEPISGGILPKELTRVGDQLAAQIAFHPESKQTIDNVVQYLNGEIHPEDNAFHFYYAVMYPSLPYFPSALAILLGRTWNASPLILMYMGRWSNLIVCCLLIFLAIKITPIHKWGFLLLSLTPMFMSQTASLSADALTNAISFLYIAWFLRCAFGNKQRLERKDILELVLLTIALSFTKQPYFILLLLYLLIPMQKGGSFKKYIGLFFLIGIVSLSCLLLWRMAASDVRIMLPKGVSPTDQVQYILNHPVQFAVILFADYMNNAWKYLHMFIGILGWLDTPMPPLMVLSYAAMLFFAALVDGKETIPMSLWQRCVIVVVLLLMMLAVSTALYVTWTPVGNSEILGISGRYFIPMSPLFLLAIYNRKLSLDIRTHRLHLVFGYYTLVSTLVCIFVVIQRYYLSP